MRCIAEVERFGGELELEALSQAELAMQTEIPVDQARPAQRSIARVSEARLSDRRESERIEIRRVASHVAEDRHRRLHLIGTLSGVGQIQRRSGRGDVDGCSAVETP